MLSRGGEGHTKRSSNCPGSGTSIFVTPGRHTVMKTWRHLPPILQNKHAEWIDPMRYDDLIGDHLTSCSTPLLDYVAEALPSEPDPALDIRPWREEYKANLQAAWVEIDKREEDHSAYLNDFLQQHGRLPTLQEDKFSDGLEMFTNRLIPGPQRGRKRRHGSEDESKDGEDGKNGKNGREEGNEDDSEDYSEPDDGEIVDNSLDPDYEDR